MNRTEIIRALFAERRTGYTLPQGLYVDPAVHDFDICAIFPRTWLQAGFESEIPAPGDYLTLEVGDSPIVVVRNQDGAVGAFFNTCRHRGAQICLEKHGHAVRLVCPYHQWSYDLRGRLVQAARMHEGFDWTGFNLCPIKVETVAGVIFICLGDHPPDFTPFRNALEPMIEPHELRKTKLVHTQTLIEQADWKLVMENARECYHCRAGHPQLMRSYRDFTVKETSGAPQQWEKAFIQNCESKGLPTREVIAAWYQIGRYPLGDGIFSYTMDGKPAVTKTLGRVGDGDVGTMWWGVQPNCFNHVVGDYAFCFQAWPTGPGETTVTGKWFVHQDAVEGADYDLGRLIEVWTATNTQDGLLVENAQRGIKSMAYTPGPYSQITEQLVVRLLDWYCESAESFLRRT
jgi:glycine betaine monooxygenase A